MKLIKTNFLFASLISILFYTQIHSAYAEPIVTGLAIGTCTGLALDASELGFPVGWLLEMVIRSSLIAALTNNNQRAHTAAWAASWLTFLVTYAKKKNEKPKKEHITIVVDAQLEPKYIKTAIVETDL